MKQISAQIKDNVFHPFSAEDLEVMRSYKPNQIVRLKIYGTRKQRSIAQLRAYWAACKTVSENCEDLKFNTKEKVDFNCRVACHFVDPDIVAVKPDGSVVFKYRSISFDNLGHIEACNYFDRAFEFMAQVLGCRKEDLIK